MVLNVEVTDDVAEALAGGKVTLSAPPNLEKLPLGVSAIDDVEAVISAAGITIAFELESEEVRAIQRGSNQFLIHFHIFERSEFNLDNGTDPTQEENDPEPGLPDSEGESKTN